MRKSVNRSSLHSNSDSVAILCISCDPILSSFLPISKGWLLSKGLTVISKFCIQCGVENKKNLVYMH